jgi:hypothetical protein
LTLVPEADSNYDEALKARVDFLSEVDAYLLQVRESIDSALAEEESRMQMSIGLRSEGFPGTALDLIEEDLTEADSAPAYRVVWGNLLLETGRVEEAWEVLERNAPAFSDPDSFAADHMAVFSQWSTDTAIANLLGGDANRAVELLDAASDPRMRQAAQTLLMMAPLSDKPSIDQGIWGGFRPNLLGGLAVEMSENWAAQQFLAASAEIEAQQTDRAAERLAFVLERSPHTSFRPLIAMYLSLITDQPAQFRLDIDLPIWGGMFADDSPASSEESPMTTPEDGLDSENAESTEPAADNAETEPPSDNPLTDEAVSTGEANTDTDEATAAESDGILPDDDTPPPPADGNPE